MSNSPPAQIDATRARLPPMIEPSTSGSRSGSASASATQTPSTILQVDDPTASTSVDVAKLDAVLYNFFAKSVAIVTNARLTHWSQQLNADVPRSDNGDPLVVNRWFDVPLPELDLFTAELRLWRHVSHFATPAALEASVETPAGDDLSAAGARIPPLVLDVLLDLTQLTPSEAASLMLESGGARSRALPQGANEFPQTIVLERWRIDSNVFLPESPPSLKDLYRRCTSHMLEMASTVTAFPSAKLCRTIKDARKAGTGVGPSGTGSLQIGCRLGAGEPEMSSMPSEVSLKRRLPLQHDAKGRRISGPASVTEVQGFAPIITPLGSINVSVEYRQDSAFFVPSTASKPSTIAQPSAPDFRNIAYLTHTGGGLIASEDLKPDEDYFKPSSLGSAASARPAQSSSGEVTLSSPSRPVSVNRRSSRLGNDSHKVEELTSPQGNASPGLGPISSSAPTSTSTPQKFPLMATTSTSTKPVAGLSALRHQGSFVRPGRIASYDVPTLSGSPGSAEPAFLASHARRVSSSSGTASATERRLSKVNAASSDRSSPPSPSTGAPSPSSISRPGLPSHMRFGSYSPSSPSPLAQQLASANAASRTSLGDSQPRQQSAALAFLQSSPTASLSAPQGVFSLRSIFHHYIPRTASASAGEGGQGSSISSLSNRRISSSPSGSSPRPSLRRVGSGGSTHDSPATSALSTSPLASRPTVSPQMIQRYARTPSYRSAQRQSEGDGEGKEIGSSSSGDYSGATGTGGRDGAVPGSGSYSRSWQARAEARQQAALMMAAQSQRQSPGASHLRGSSSGSPSFLGHLQRPGTRVSPSTDTVQGGCASSSSTAAKQKRSSGSDAGNRPSVDELVALIDSRPTLPPASTGTSSSTAAPPKRRSPSALHSPGAETNPQNPSPRESSDVLLSTSAMDDMLAKMAFSMQRLSLPATSRPQNRGTFGDVSGEPLQSDSRFAKAQPDPDSISIEGGLGAIGGNVSPQDRFKEDFKQPRPLPLSQAPNTSSLSSSSSSSPQMQRHHSSQQLFARGTSASGGAIGQDEEEELVGRLELHSDPATPTAERALGLGGNDVESAIGAEYNSSRLATGDERARQRDPLAIPSRTTPKYQLLPHRRQRPGAEESDAADAERLLRTFGEELSSNRGRRGGAGGLNSAAAHSTTGVNVSSMRGTTNAGSSTSPWRSRRAATTMSPATPMPSESSNAPPSLTSAAGTTRRKPVSAYSSRRPSPHGYSQRSISGQGGGDEALYDDGGNVDPHPPRQQQRGFAERWRDYQSQRDNDV
ncbi:unnamed protein product [Jaminaea pallidilutea]